MGRKKPRGLRKCPISQKHLSEQTSTYFWLYWEKSKCCTTRGQREVYRQQRPWSLRRAWFYPPHGVHLMYFVSVQSLMTYPNMGTIRPTLDDVEDKWAKVVYGDGLARMNISESRRQVVRFISREALVEPVDLQMIVFFVWDTFDSSLRSFNVL